MKSSLIALIVAATLAFGSAAHAGLFTYTHADVYGGWLRPQRQRMLGGPSTNVVGTAYLICGQWLFRGQHDQLNIGGVGTCNYSLCVAMALTTLARPARASADSV